MIKLGSEIKGLIYSSRGIKGAYLGETLLWSNELVRLHLAADAHAYDDALVLVKSGDGNTLYNLEELIIDGKYKIRNDFIDEISEGEDRYIIRFKYAISTITGLSGFLDKNTTRIYAKTK